MSDRLKFDFVSIIIVVERMSFIKDVNSKFISIFVNLHLVNDKARSAFLFNVYDDREHELLELLVRMMFPKLTIISHPAFNQQKPWNTEYWIILNTNRLPEKIFSYSDLRANEKIRGETLDYAFTTPNIAKGFGKNEVPNIYLRYVVLYPVATKSEHQKESVELFTYTTGKSSLDEFTSDESARIEAQVEKFKNSCQKINCKFQLEFLSCWFSPEYQSRDQVIKVLS